MPLTVSLLPAPHNGDFTFLQNETSALEEAERQLKSAITPQLQFPTPQVGTKGLCGSLTHPPDSQSVL